MADSASQRNVITRVTCPSTQDIVRDEALAGAPAGTICVTDHQSAGRGRRGCGGCQLISYRRKV